MPFANLFPCNSRWKINLFDCEEYPLIIVVLFILQKNESLGGYGFGNASDLLLTNPAINVKSWRSLNSKLAS